MCAVGPSPIATPAAVRVEPGIDYVRRLLLAARTPQPAAGALDRVAPGVRSSLLVEKRLRIVAQGGGGDMPNDEDVRPARGASEGAAKRVARVDQLDELGRLDGEEGKGGDDHRAHHHAASDGVRRDVAVADGGDGDDDKVEGLGSAQAEA